PLLSLAARARQRAIDHRRAFLFPSGVRMSLFPHLVYYADKKLRTPLDLAYVGVTDFMKLASEPTRHPIDACVIRHLVEDNRVIEAIEEREAGLSEDSPKEVRLLVEEGLRRFKEPDISVTVTWCPNLQWRGRDTFSRIGLEEENYFLGQERTHFIRLTSGNVP